MNRFDIINRIGDKYRVGNTETGEFSYAQALKTVGEDIKDYQKATTGTQHKFLDLRFENERLAVLVECKNKFSRWDKAKIQGQLQDYVRFEKAYSDKKIVAILAETDGDEVWVWFGQSVIIDDEHRMEEEIVLRTFEEYEMLDNYTLDAVFSLPTEMFYPGAAAVACCMIFDLSQKHEKANKETFFGYYKDDKFIKRKGLGRVERTDADGNSLWNKTEEIWLNLYKNKKVVPGLSVMLFG